MTVGRYDFAIAGGGLSGGLIALALRQARPELSVVVCEAGAAIGGNHRWSWFASDLPQGGAALLRDIRTTEWNTGYDVRFPAHERTLATPYRSISSADFAAALARTLPDGALRTQAEIAGLDAAGVTLASGERIAARTVIDCRGVARSPHLSGGWQVFMGRHLRTRTAHGIGRPTIMDARVDQSMGDRGAYRFVYVLPLGGFDLFVEDTYYTDSPDLDRSALSRRIDEYCAERGWTDAEIVGSETGVLPVVTGGDFDAFQAEMRVPGVAVAGVRGGFFHPLTSYTLPFAVDTALAIAGEADLPGDQLAALVENRARALWKRTQFYRLLGTMLFGAGDPAQRYRVFEHFYRLPEPLIERFYAARDTFADRTRILCGKPPVPIGGAVRALIAGGKPLAQRMAA